MIKTILCLATLLNSPLAVSEEPSETQNISSSSGLINRAPLVSSKFKSSNLDRISTDISNITESLSNILTDAIDEEEKIATEVEEIEEPAQQKIQPFIAEPEKIIPKKIEVAKPVIKQTKPLMVEKTQLDAPPPLQVEEVLNTSQKQPKAVAKQDLPTENQIKYLKKGGGVTEKLCLTM